MRPDFQKSLRLDTVCPSRGAKVGGNPLNIMIAPLELTSRSATGLNLVVFDLETTGFSHRWHDIIQIAAVRLCDGPRCGETFSTYVRPRGPIPRPITYLTGITDADVADAPEAPEALRAFARFVADAGGEGGSEGAEPVLVAHNGHRFDLRFIIGACERHALPMRPARFIDSLWLSKKLWPAEPLHDLDMVIERLGISEMELPASRHDARADVCLLAEAVRRMLDGLGDAASPEREALRCDFVAA